MYGAGRHGSGPRTTNTCCAACERQVGRVEQRAGGTWDCPVGPEPTRPGSGALSVTMPDVNEDRVRHCSGVREGFHLRGAVCTWHGIRQKRTTEPLPTGRFLRRAPATERCGVRPYCQACGRVEDFSLGLNRAGPVLRHRNARRPPIVLAHPKKWKNGLSGKPKRYVSPWNGLTDSSPCPAGSSGAWARAKVLVSNATYNDDCRLAEASSGCVGRG